MTRELALEYCESLFNNTIEYLEFVKALAEFIKDPALAEEIQMYSGGTGKLGSNVYGGFKGSRYNGVLERVASGELNNEISNHIQSVYNIIDLFFSLDLIHYEEREKLQKGIGVKRDLVEPVIKKTINTIKSD